MLVTGPPPPSVLLGRPEFCGELRDAASFAEHRRVLVTGAGGSVGSPLANVLKDARPAHLTLLDHHEHSLFSLERSLGPASANHSYELADIGDERRLARIFERHRPDTVIHLAAAKHVPYGERFPEGAVAANVLALRRLLDLAAAHDVERFVYPSSDKSVQPPSVYGATKRLAEALLQAAVARHARRWSIVRFVNIIGTRGSVIETFSLQVQTQQPLTVTDERMTRYWISMDEAVWSVLLAAQCAAAGEVVMPTCGEPVPVIETARQLAGWYRPQEVPYPIATMGIRPGERLHEVLLSANESFAVGPGQGLRSVRTKRDPATLDALPDLIAELDRLVEEGGRERLARLCLAAAETLQ